MNFSDMLSHFIRIAKPLITNCTLLLQQHLNLNLNKIVKVICMQITLQHNYNINYLSMTRMDEKGKNVKAN